MTLVECQDCGYRWESSADSPRCSKADCGRSRNVEPVEQAADEPDEDDSQDPVDDDAEHVEAEPVEDDDDQDDADDGGGFAAAFESREQAADLRDEPSPPTDDDQDDDADEQADDDADGTPDPEDIPDINPEQLEAGFTVTFDLIANRRGEHWELAEREDGKDEAEQLAEVWTPVLNHYAPYLFKKHTEVGVAVLASATILAPRLAEDRRQAEQREREEQDRRDGEPGEPREPEPVEDADIGTEWTDEQDAEQTAGGYANV